MASMARRKFTREFKVSAVQLVNHQGYSVAEPAKSLGVDPNCVRGWVVKYGREAGAVPSGEGAVPPLNAPPTLLSPLRVRSASNQKSVV